MATNFRAIEIRAYNHRGGCFYKHSYDFNQIKASDIAEYRIAFADVLSGISIDGFGVASFKGSNGWSIIVPTGEARFELVDDARLVEGIIVRNNRGVAAWPGC